jgi:hypothetical protein
LPREEWLAGSLFGCRVEKRRFSFVSGNPLLCVGMAVVDGDMELERGDRAEGKGKERKSKGTEKLVRCLAVRRVKRRAVKIRWVQ